MSSRRPGWALRSEPGGDRVRSPSRRSAFMTSTRLAMATARRIKSVEKFLGGPMSEDEPRADEELSGA